MSLLRKVRVTSFISLIAVVLAAAVWFNHQYLTDQFNVWRFRPSSEVVSLADRSGMNDEGKFLFYASQPQIDDAQNFNGKCGQSEASTAILGCYAGQRIYLYNVTNAQIDGIKEVTAAHEMLHAAYDRMTSNERTQVNAFVEAEYAVLKNDKTFAQRMAFYAKTEPGERDNELYSIIGTEVAAISPELENHYRQYFTDRSLVTSLHTKYAAVFANLQSQEQQLSDQLTKLGNTIDSDSIKYNAQVSQLNTDIQAFNQEASNSGFSSEAEFQSARTALVSRVDALNALRTTINDAVTQYSALKQELAAVSTQSDTLNRSIDSNLAPAPSV